MQFGEADHIQRLLQPLPHPEAYLLTPQNSALKNIGMEKYFEDRLVPIQ
jgi:hypothetical protein